MMMGATSFVNHTGNRPPRYRTPSPPRRAVEPITPGSTTMDTRTSQMDRGLQKAVSVDRDQFAVGTGRQTTTATTTTEGGPQHRAGHGRSSSTIDTLATIALATSPTFAPASYRPQSHSSSTSPMPLFPPESAEFSEPPPAKRQRSEKGSTSPHPPTETAPPKNPASSGFSDSMKTDAELLLNLARPNNFPPVAHHHHHQSHHHPHHHQPKRVSIDESAHYRHDAKHHHMDSRYDESMYADNNTFGNSYFPPSRTRSQSDGSTAITRPVIRDLRPSTSSSTLAPIPWQEEAVEQQSWAPTYNPQDQTIAAAPAPAPPSSPPAPSAPPVEASSTKVEEDTTMMDVDDGNQASCAACHRVRIPVESGEQGDVTWISCDGCKQWFHIVCAGFKNDREIRTVDKFICRGCWPVYGRTTFVRKSSRARTAIDYAGLNQGLVKAASDSLEHHYVEPIREGQIQFQPENFPRMHPDLVTAQYFERGTGWSEPVVIPAHWNTRESTATVGSDFDALVGEAPTQEMFDELLDNMPEEGKNYEQVIDCGQDMLDMVIPENLNVRTVAELYGPDERVEVIDVKSQQGEDKRWTMQKWADYYESTGSKVVRNVISLEVSQSRLGRLIRRPKIVRDLDLQDAVWPKELQAVGDFPKVQFYCLMSVADCYTDFHIDFGGSSVYYHILKGTKTFFFIPPKDKHLKKYEEWCNSPAQDNIFLGDQTKECYRVDLREGDTMLIPSGWIHAVWTPKNSLVIGGNFLTRLNYGMQIKVANIEKDTKVPRKFRYPFFQKIQWYTALKYLEEDPIPQSVLEAFMQDENYRFHRDYPVYYEFGERENTDPRGSPYYNARFYSQAELEGLIDLSKYLLRTALIAGSYVVEGVTVDTRNAIKRSIPKGVGDPIDTIRNFGVWVAWKRGNEPAQPWTRPGVIENNPKVNFTEKKSAGRPSRRSERNADNQRTYTERQAVQLPERPSRPEPPSMPIDTAGSVDDTPGASNGLSSSSGTGTEIGSGSGTATTTGSATGSGSTTATVKEETATPNPNPNPNPKPRNTSRGSGLGPKRVACDACRRRRIRCSHKDEQNDPSANPMAVNVFGVGLQNQPYMAHDAATALSSLAAVASEAGLQDNGGNNMGLYDSAMPSAKVYGSPDAGKKGRSKACEDCRKSKRRCVHDEHGRIDPIKAQERSKPRVTSAKRPRPNDDISGPEGAIDAKRPKQESTSPLTRPVELDTASAPQHMMDSIPSETPSKPVDHTVTESEKANSLGQSSYASPPAFQTDNLVPQDVDQMVLSSQPTALVSPPTSQADEADERVDRDGGSGGAGDGDSYQAMQTPAASSRHSSRQPRHVVPEIQAATATAAAKPTPAQRRRRASFAASAGVRKTPPAKRPASRPTSSHAGHSHSHGHGQNHQSHDHAHAHAHAQTQNPEMDEDSLRLIREIQEQEFGLRKRSTRA